jgi:hypothetical protein
MHVDPNHISAWSPIKLGGSYTLKGELTSDS